MWTPYKATIHFATLAFCLSAGLAQTSSAGGAAEKTAVEEAAAKKVDRESGRTNKKPSCAIIGASVSAGMAWRRYEIHSPDPDPIMFAEKLFKRVIETREYDLRTDSTPIATLIRRLDPKKRIEVRNLTHTIYRRPNPILANQLRNASKRSRLVVGLDLMVWFGYGDVKRLPRDVTAAEQSSHEAKERLALQAQGFALIDKYMTGNQSIFVIGDYPNLEASNRILLKPHQRPTDEVLAELNRRFYAFAAKRERVVAFPLKKTLDTALRSELKVVIDGEVRMLRTADVLQLDEIHPNNFGVALLLTYVTDMVKKEAPQVADCLPELPDLVTLFGMVGVKVKDLDYLMTRSRAGTKK